MEIQKLWTVDSIRKRGDDADEQSFTVEDGKRPVGCRRMPGMMRITQVTLIPNWFGLFATTPNM